MSACESGEWARAEALFVRLRDEWGPSDLYESYLRGIEIARASDG